MVIEYLSEWRKVLNGVNASTAPRFDILLMQESNKTTFDTLLASFFFKKYGFSWQNKKGD